MAIIDLEEETKLLRKRSGETGVYDALKLPISEIRVTGNLVLNNPVLTPVNGIATWTIPVHGTDVILQLKEIATGNPVIAPYDITTTVGVTTSYTLNININASTQIAANTYRAVVIG